MHSHTICCVFAVFLVGCTSSQSPIEGERKLLSQAECKAQDGTIVYDIGDGATHRPEYVCASGKSALGSIVFTEEEGMPDEGAVCCPR